MLQAIVISAGKLHYDKLVVSRNVTTTFITRNY